MKFDAIRIVLVATSHPGNIGSTARAMKTMGLTHLYLVTPQSFPDVRANELAAGADDVLQQAVVTHSLREALQDCHLVLATSARSRELALPSLTPAEAAELIVSTDDETKIAIVFGREHAGLTNDELLHCHYHLNIPTLPTFSSLNLAQAVQIVAYELRTKFLSADVKVSPSVDKSATIEEVERFYVHLRQVLIELDFLKLSNPKKLMQRLRRLFNRSKLEQVEVNILRGILTHVQEAIKKETSCNE